MKILLTGKNGQLGFELQRALAPLGQVLAVDRQECDLTDADAIRQLVRSVQPDLIVNPAAYTAVDRAESEPDAAAALNATAPGILGEEAALLGAWVIHYSTDYVFDGLSQSAYRETDATNPRSVYGCTKRDGDVALQQSCDRHLILRSSWVVGAHGNNFAKTMLRLAGERDNLNIVADQHGAPTSAALLADVTAQLVGRARRESLADFPFGLYHLTAGGVTTWYDFACFVIKQARQAGKPLKTMLDNIRPITTEEYPLPAKRPANSHLDTTLFRTTFNLELPDWQLGIHHVLQQILTS
ncbi:dTDP-4-dehydrorhamnose reductase [uncultured Desulfobulbus sp.]|uniref:dTDP-4-dehydrorhamnose reductase n=1 Tax=uncultured Desulfobulbus sp. TaxID=239745 RepID=UPI0029C8EBF1|nr:dTDP-4-dehydrorhamnose reductase [uncultured Desulfobulbus sp.]